MTKLTILLLFSCVSLRSQSLDKAYEEKLIHAIFIAEGGNNTRFKFGVEMIKDGKAYQFNNPYQVCRNTINHSWQRFIKQANDKDFISFLGKTYSQDRLWPVKVKKIMQR